MLTAMFEKDKSGPPVCEWDDLHSLVEPGLADLMSTIDDALASDVGGVGFIDESFELAKPDLADYTDFLARLISQSDDPAAKTAAYHAFHFACCIASLTLAHTPALNFGDFYGQSDPASVGLPQRLHQSSQEYLQARPALDQLTARYMPEIDPTGKWAHVAEMVAATTFMFIDKGEQWLAEETAAADFALALDSWDGAI